MSTQPITMKRAKLEARKKNLEAEVKQVKADILDLQEPILNGFVEDGIASVQHVYDGRVWTIFAQTTARVKIKPDVAKEDVALCLRRAGPAWHAMVRQDFNLNALSALVRERLTRDDGGTDELPPTLAALIDVVDDTSIRATSKPVTRSASKKALAQ